MKKTISSTVGALAMMGMLGCSQPRVHTPLDPNREIVAFEDARNLAFCEPDGPLIILTKILYNDYGNY